MKLARIPLKPYSRFHFGEMKLNHDLALSDTSLFAHSDTLFSALTNAYSCHNGGAEDFIKHFEPTNSSIKISSLFYYLQHGEGDTAVRVYFLPKPVIIDLESPKTAEGTHKKRNRIKFVSLGTWENGFEADKWFDESSPNYHVLDKSFVMTKAEHEQLGSPVIESIAKTVLSPKSPIRAEDNQAIYYQADVETGSCNGLSIGVYFLYEAEGKAETDLQIATNIMAFTGIGGEIRNTGRTVKDKPEFDTLHFVVPTDPLCYVCVSLMNPSDASDFGKVKYYSSILRGGRLLGKDEGGAMVVRMIEEGALVISNNVKGRLVSLGPDEQDREIYRLGIPFLIPIRYDS